MTAIMATALVALSLARQPGSRVETNLKVYLRRVGPYRIGMTLKEVRGLLKDPDANLAGPDPDQPLDQCGYLESETIPKGLGLMFRKRRLVRIDIDGPGIQTAKGVSIGSTEVQIRSVYASRIRTEPHHYLHGHYLVYSPIDAADRGLGIVFETEDGIVKSFRVGTRAAVALAEGCS